MERFKSVSGIPVLKMERQIAELEMRLEMFFPIYLTLLVKWIPDDTLPW